ncbi:MAG TPA: glutathione peroxidase [Vineibacter sp.]|nr:glutathione peroxidase [Vineibacter sp.]
MATIYDFAATAIDGTPVQLDTYRGRVLLIVNTASLCGFAPQFKGLESLWRDYQDRGLVVVGFPSNQFAQELRSDDQIATFCGTRYGVSFPMMSKIDVNGSGAHPLYKWLTREKPDLFGPWIKWNFTKFLIGRDGAVVRRYAPTDPPSALRRDIEAALAAD